MDGAIDVLTGMVRVFVPDGGACYECTLSAADWAILDQRRACSLLPRDSRPAEPHVPTTPTTASVIGGLQCGEAVKLLHGIEGLRNAGFHMDGQGFDCYKVTYRRDPECYGHDRFEDVHEWEAFSCETPLEAFMEEVRTRFGPEAVIESVRELVREIRCPGCGTSEGWRGALEALDSESATCPSCGATRYPEVYHALSRGGAPAGTTLRELGIPPWDILQLKVGGRLMGIELSGDRPRFHA